jgi:peptide/nickel transport system substrate-binding protein
MGEATRSPIRRSSAPFLAAVLSAALLAGACGGSSPAGNQQATPPGSEPVSQKGGATAGPPDEQQPVSGGRISFGIEGEPEGMDPTRYVLSESGHSVASAVFDPLATLDENGKAVPYLATAIQGSDENKTWTITLPTGVTFHDGTPFNADAVIQNFKAYQASYVTKLALNQVASIEAPDASHVVVKLKTPWAAFPTALTSQLGYMIAPAMINDPGLVNKPIGTGPFVFQSHTPNQTWAFKKNESYWRQGLPRLDAIDFQPMPDNAERLRRLQAGDIDMMHTNEPQSILELRSDNSFKRVENDAGSEEFILLNTQAEPFDSLTARQAVAFATDRAGYRKQVHRDVMGPANSPFAPGQLGYEENNGFPEFDPARAKELVAQYQRETGKPLAFTFYSADDPLAQLGAQNLSKPWIDAGMQVTLKGLPQINLIAQDATGNYQASVFRNFSFPDPDTDTVFWRSSSIAPSPNVSLNFPRHASPELDALMDKALASSDPKERDELYKQVGRIWAKDLPYIWLGRPDWMLAAVPRVNGIYAARNGSIETIGAKTWIAELWIGK